MIGLPKIPGLQGRAIAVGLLGAAEAALWNYLSTPLTWAIYNAGTNSAAVKFDSIVTGVHSGKAEAPIYPITQGSFITYNKVSRPSEVKLTITKGGNPNERKQFLDWLEKNKGEATLYDIVTPETAYKSVTLVDYTNVRDVRSGTVTMLKVDCTFHEVRQVPAQYYKASEGKANTTNAAKPADTPTKQGRFASALEYIPKNIRGAFDANAQFGNLLGN